jgi:ribosomal protein S6--L-glutamate ligase
VTAFTHDSNQAEDIIDLVGGPPVVIKLLEGTQGIGVVLGETESSAKSVIEAFRGANVNILVQKFISEAQGTDIRAFVIGDKVVASIKRKGPKNDFRSNLHRGGSAATVRITREERSAALKAAKTLGLNVCGVDMLRSDQGPVVMEVNSSPGLEGIEKATGRDIASEIVGFIEHNAKPNATKTKGRG